MNRKNKQPLSAQRQGAILRAHDKTPSLHARSTIGKCCTQKQSFLTCWRFALAGSSRADLRLSEISREIYSLAASAALQRVGGADADAAGSLKTAPFVVHLSYRSAARQNSQYPKHFTKDRVVKDHLEGPATLRQAMSAVQPKLWQLHIPICHSCLASASLGLCCTQLLQY